MVKTCSRCGKEKEVLVFYPGEGANGLRYECKECGNEGTRKSRAQTKETRKQEYKKSVNQVRRGQGRPNWKTRREMILDDWVGRQLSSHWRSFELLKRVESRESKAQRLKLKTQRGVGGKNPMEDMFIDFYDRIYHPVHVNASTVKEWLQIIDDVEEISSILGVGKKFVIRVERGDFDGKED